MIRWLKTDSGGRLERVNKCWPYLYFTFIQYFEAFYIYRVNAMCQFYVHYSIDDVTLEIKDEVFFESDDSDFKILWGIAYVHVYCLHTHVKYSVWNKAKYMLRHSISYAFYHCINSFYKEFPDVHYELHHYNEAIYIHCH